MTDPRANCSPWPGLAGLCVVLLSCGGEEPSGDRCGDGVCGSTETVSTCPVDCGGLACGDGVCSATESSLSCAVDCYCGNGQCDAPENLSTCPVDCSEAVCGNDACEPGESNASCPEDCPAQCGNQVVESGEQCDGALEPDQTCLSVAGDQAGLLSCGADCQFDTSDCRTCGDGLQEGIESCDGNDLDGQSCVSQGYSGGSLACRTSCSFDYTDCWRCGDGLVEGPEECDGANLGPAPPTCVDLGFDGGTVQCAGGCLSYQTSDCFACGDGTCDSAQGETMTTCPADCGWATVSAGTSFTCATLGDGTPYCWGRNDDGQLGDTTTTDRSVPTPVSNLTGVSSIYASNAWVNHATCATTSLGRVYCWGENGCCITGANGPNAASPVWISSLSNIQSVVVGDSHACALSTGGSVYCWGCDWAGQLGQGTTTAGSCGPVNVSGLSQVTALSGGEDFTCALKQNGTVWCWGAGGSCQTSTGGSDPTPVQIPGLAGVIHLASGREHSCAVLGDGTIWCWGDNFFSQSADAGASNICTPYQWTAVTNAVAAGAGGTHSCALLATGGAMCWGFNWYGQCGDGNTNGSAWDPTPVMGSSIYAALNLGGEHSCGVTDGHRIRCWGSTADGQIGVGSFSGSYPVPTLVNDP